MLIQLLLPVLGIEGEQVALRAEAVGRHLVEHGGYPEVTRIGRRGLCARDLSLRLDSHVAVGT